LTSTPPPLISVEGAPPPKGMQPAWFEGQGGVRLRAAILPASGPPRGSVVLSTGRTECLEKYFETAGDLAGRGFTVLLHDWRGQGLSQRLLADRLRGHAEGFDDFLADYRSLLTAYQDRLPKPWLMVGHSMGGCLNLLALAKGERRFAAALLAAPMLGLHLSPIKKVASGPLSRLLHSFGRGGDFVPGQEKSAWTAFAGNPLTHDPARYKRMYDQLEAEPALALGGPTWGWLDSAMTGMAWLRRSPQIALVDIPVTILSAEADTIVDNAAQAAVAARLPKARLVVVPGAFHEILQETDDRRAVFLAEFDALADAAAPRRAKKPRAPRA
jgi:lysophospholipase